MKDNTKPVLAVTMGDPAGIGPEICVKALGFEELYRIARPFVVGDKGVLDSAVAICKSPLKVRAIDHPRECTYEYGVINVLDLKNLPMEELKRKTATAAQGKASFEYVDKAISLALKKDVDATVTGPITKESVKKAGLDYAGHTEIYAAKTGTRDYTMMLADENFRVVHVSTHLPLRKACDAVKKERVLRVIELADAAVSRLIGASPKIGVAGLNPHCGEARMFGTEDEDEILPAVEAAKAKGLRAEGPIPADTIFSKMQGGYYDVVVAMYHDQGHIPSKFQGFKCNPETGEWESFSGVNVTLGLPIIRTSVDHGTAYDIAGTGMANPQSMCQAIKMAAELALDA